MEQFNAPQGQKEMKTEEQFFHLGTGVSFKNRPGKFYWGDESKNKIGVVEKKIVR